MGALMLGTDDRAIAQAAELLIAGQQVAFPTETVYGLGADARNSMAVAGIYQAKGRPSFNPLIVHVPDMETAEKYGAFPPEARKLADAFWPGPLTLVVPRRADCGLSELVTAGLPTLAIRCPAAPLARRLLAAANAPVAAPSANSSGKVSPTTAQHVQADLSEKIAAIVDGGACSVGVESTIIGFENGIPTLLRPGGVAAEDIEDVLGYSLGVLKVADVPTAPGQLSSHYAPGAKVRLDVTHPEANEGYLAFGPLAAELADYQGPIINLSAKGDMQEAAANLFASMIEMDRLLEGQGGMAVAPIPNEGLGDAINDRLRRAAAPRGDLSLAD